MFAQGKITDEDYLKGKENDTEVFVITSDSVKHSGTKLKFPPRYFKTSEYIAIDGVRYSRKKKQDIITFQTEDWYCVYFPTIGDDITRIRKGKVNLYFYYVDTYTPGHATADYARHYVIEKEKNTFVIARYEVLENAFADNSAVLEKFHELFPDKEKADKIFLKINIPFKVEAETLKSMLLLMDMYNGN
ncbi:hypothetical protein [Ferruginibacter sp.]